MKIQTKWLLSITLVSLATVLASCGQSNVYDPDNFLIEGTPENPYQVVTDPVTLKVFVPRGAMNPSFSSMKMFQRLSEVTHLQFDFTEADTSAYSSMRATAWEDNDNLPDLFLFSNPISEQVTYSQYGAMVPLNDAHYEIDGLEIGSLIDQYMPTYKAYLDNNFNIDTNENAREIATLDDGFMYSFLQVNDVPRDLTFKMFINQTWIDNCNQYYLSAEEQLPNATEISTIEQYIRVLRAFKQYDANRNGDNTDEIPVSAASLNYLRNFILESYGYVADDVELSADGSQFVYVPTTEAYKKYLETMAILYSEGLLDNNTFALKTDSQLLTKGAAHRLGSFCAAAAYLAVGETYEDEYQCFGPITSSFYNGPAIQLGISYFKPVAAVIPQGTPYVREIARLLDIMYGDLGQQLISYGIEGENWTWDNEEHSSWTFIVPEDWTGTQETYRATITPNVGTGSSMFWSYDFVGKMNDERIHNLNSMSERYTPYLKVPVPEKYKLTSSDYDNSARLQTSLQLYISSAECDFVKGIKTVSNDWSSFQEDLEDYSYAQYLGYFNSALARYNASHAQ